MIDVRTLPDAWETIDRLTGSEASEKDSLYDIYYKISMALFDYREEHKLSQKKLAEILGVTQPMVAKLESGDYNYTVEQLWKIATKLNFKFNIDFEMAPEYTVRQENKDNDCAQSGINPPVRVPMINLLKLKEKKQQSQGKSKTE